MKTNLYNFGGATLAAIALLTTSSLGQVTITETETVNPPVIEEHSTTTTTTTPAPVIQDPVLTDDYVDDLEDRMENRGEVREELNEAREERADELSDELEDLD